MESLKWLLAITLLVLGLAKIAVGMAVLILPQNVRGRIPFVKETKDATLAGHMYEYVMMAFGAYLVVFGMNLLDWIVVPPVLFISVMMLLGTVLVIFYSVVLFSDIPMSKDPSNRSTYLVRGLGSGVFFLLIPFLWMLVQWALPIYRTFAPLRQVMIFLSLVVAGVIIMDLLTLRIKNENVTTKEIVLTNIQSRLWV